MKPPPPHQRTPMQLVAIDGKRILAGNDGCLVYVLQKHDDTTFTLHCVRISSHDQTLRSFLTADQCEQVETAIAIREANKPARTRRKGKA